jgi:hypothetical protein
VSPDYPLLVNAGAGSINASTGKSWTAAADFKGEDYIGMPNQPWLDGFCVRLERFIPRYPKICNGIRCQETCNKGSLSRLRLLRHMQPRTRGPA